MIIYDYYIKVNGDIKESIENRDSDIEIVKSEFEPADKQIEPKNDTDDKNDNKNVLDINKNNEKGEDEKTKVNEEEDDDDYCKYNYNILNIP